MSGDDGEGKILEEITKGGLPSNVRAEIVPEAPRLELASVYGVGDEPIGTIVTTPVCGQNYTANGRVFPEKCSLPAGHKPKTTTSNHYTFGLGWWA